MCLYFLRSTPLARKCPVCSVQTVCCGRIDGWLYQRSCSGKGHSPTLPSPISISRFSVATLLLRRETFARTPNVFNVCSC
jgi:hypothetical protein